MRGPGWRIRHNACRAIIGWLLAAMLTTQALATESGTATALRDLAPYRAVYSSSARGIDVTVFRQLASAGEGLYKLQTGGSKLLYGYSETSSFTLSATRVRPEMYHYKGTGLNRRQSAIAFDWTALRASSRYKGKDYELPISASTQDRISWQESLRFDLLNGIAPDSPELASLQVLDGRRTKGYRLQYLGVETIDTPAGQFRALHFNRLGRKPGRDLHFWLAADWDFLLLRAEQTDDEGDHIVAELREAVIEDRQVGGENQPP